MNDQNFTYNTPPQYTYEKPKNIYNKADLILAILLLPLSFAIVRAMSASEYPLGNFLCSLLLFALSGIYLIKQEIKLTSHRFAFSMAVCALILSAGLIVTSNPSLRALLSFLISAIYIYWIFAATGNSSEKLPFQFFFFEMIKATFVMSFGGMGYMIEALSGAKRSKKIGKNLLLVLAGLAIALIPSMIAFALLSYDESFKHLTRNLLDFSIYDAGVLISDLILTLPLALLLFGILYSGRCRKYSEVLCAEKCERAASFIRFAPAVLAVSATAPFILIYSVFFASQLDYYLSAFGGVLPEGLSYSEYARSGFFELCSVAVINLLVIFCTTVFCRLDKNGRSPIALRIVNFLMSLLTLVLIATAISKMILYINTYGLTEKRILSGSFMILLAIIFTALLLRQFLSKTNLVLISLTATLIISGILAFGDVNRVIAEYNTDRYLSGTLENFDPKQLTDLGDPGYLCLAKIAEEGNDIESIRLAKALLSEEASRREKEEISIFALTIPKIITDIELQKYK